MSRQPQNCRAKGEGLEDSTRLTSATSSPDSTTVSGPCSAADQNVTQITHLLEAVEKGDAGAAERLLDLVYCELHKLAARKLAGERAGQTVHPTALVHEAWERLNCGQGAHYENRAHFFAAAAETMRRILIDRARARLAAKRGGGLVRTDLDLLEIPGPETPDDVLMDVHEALDKFAALHPDQAELVKLRFFVGMTVEEAAEALGIAVVTAKKWWAYARAWFRIELG